ncbi:DUF1120 domain-containing protein [Serratia quinivorans]|uniref:DUF1120 domain-containing protein n=1 Tax=Serratia quinivorans TaxID=137545 RepID=UPI001C47C93E|nr:DUF1120 domain-containing protein [Serratia quinivorans]MBV6693995.1 DUF1120 domain-containing protein [Serratia quinivorans]
MKNQMQKTACALALLSTLSMQAWADSVDISVIGTITPAACTPTISGGGVIDYKTIDPATLSADAYTVLAEHTADFSISCTAPARIALKAVNGRANTLAGATEGTGGFGTSPVSILGHTWGAAGLGLNGEAKIGGFTAMYDTSTLVADDVSIIALYQNAVTGSNAWRASTGDLFGVSSTQLTSFAASGTTTPIAFENLTGKLRVQAYINKTSELDLTSAVTLDGLATLELVYI